MNKLTILLYLALSGCITKKILEKKPNNKEAIEVLQTKEIIYFTPDDSSFVIFGALMLGVVFFCFGLKYIPVIYNKIKALTKKNK